MASTLYRTAAELARQGAAVVINDVNQETVGTTLICHSTRELTPCVREFLARASA